MPNLVDLGIGAGGFATVLTAVSPFVVKQLKHAAVRIATDVLSAGVKALKEDINKRFDTNDQTTQQAAKDIQDLKVSFAKETGGNSGGFRQALNELTKDVAELSGAFHQHTQEASSK